MPTPRITIGLPVYNAMPFLPETIDSLLAQTYSDFEILAINDGSTDESLQYLCSMKDRRLRVLSQKNQGITATLNRMLSEVQTPWLVRQDADDVAYPDRLARTVEYIQRFPEAGMFYSLADYYPRQQCVGQFRSTRGSAPELRALTRAGYLLCICHPTVTLNVRKALDLGGYRFDLHTEDIDLWWRMAVRHDIQLIPEATIGFRQNTGSVSSRNLEQQALNTLYIQYLLLSHLWHLTPGPYELVQRPLQTLLDYRELKFKAHIREFNMSLAKRDYCRALYSGTAAFCSSPPTFLKRALYEVSQNQSARLGINPRTFLTFRADLWPDAERNATEKNSCDLHDGNSASPAHAATSSVDVFPRDSRACTLN